VQNTVVSTVMANLGFRKTMDEQDINVIETQVGDRYVLERCCVGERCSAGSSPGTSSSGITPPRGMVS
jgi:phosphoglucosamine mutase